MKARNEYIVIKLPERINRRHGIELPETSKQEFMVGKIVSVGDKLTKNEPARWVKGTIVAFDKWVQQHLDLDVLGKETRMVVLHEDQVYCELSEDEAKDYIFDEKPAVV